MSSRKSSPNLPPTFLPKDCEQQELGVAFFDFAPFAEWASSQEDAQIANFLQAFYALVAEKLQACGARLVKLMGDAGLVVFTKDAAEESILALCALTREGRDCARKFGLDAYLNVNIHFGPVLAGSFGPPGEERFDVIGKTVNIAARLGRRGVTLSPQAFRCLSAEARERFEKIMRPITYRLRS